jgi:hypothetical protein
MYQHDLNPTRDVKKGNLCWFIIGYVIGTKWLKGDAKIACKSTEKVELEVQWMYKTLVWIADYTNQQYLLES